MLRLVVNDVRLNAVFVFWVFLFFNVYLLLMAWLGGPGKLLLGGLQSGIAFASAMVIAIFLREEQNTGQVIIRSLPISHTRVVYARYLSITLFVIANVLYGLFYQSIVGSPRPIVHEHLDFLLMINDSFFSLEHSLAARLLAVVITISITVPLIIRYGTFWRILIGYVVVMVGWARGIPFLLGWCKSAALFFGSPGWVLLAAVIMVAMIAASIRLSIRLYGRKEL
jgi:hypothetical protein